MSTLAKVFVVIVLIFAAVLASASATLFTLRSDYKDKYEQEKSGRAADVAKLEERIATVQGDLKTAGDNLQKAESKVTTLQEALNLAKTNLTTANNEREKLAASLQNVQEQNKALADSLTQAKKDLAKKNDEVVRMLGEVKQAEDQVANLKTQLTAAQQQLQTALADNTDLREDVVILKQQLRNQASTGGGPTGGDQPKTATVPSMTARVIRVGPAPQEFIVVELGRDDKMLEGTDLMVYREENGKSTYVGMATVVRVDKEVSVAKIQQDMRARNDQGEVLAFQVNDKATTNVPSVAAGE